MIASDIYGLLDGSSNIMSLPIHNREVVHPGVMMCGVGMVTDRGRSPEMFLEPFSKGPCRFASHTSLSPLYLHITLLFCMMLPLSIGGQQEVFDCVALHEMDLEPHFATNYLETFA